MLGTLRDEGSQGNSGRQSEPKPGRQSVTGNSHPVIEEHRSASHKTPACTLCQDHR